ncbi:hypothetical protein [Streptomyces sp. NPDC014676]|uniref:hypothetical protein n=1 Tax=Streptomyces sp. NPDC014676 TaxID=3364879 RepID=UPI0036F6D0FD
MSSTYSASSGGPPTAAAEPRRIRRAVALPSADDPVAGPTTARSSRDTITGLAAPAAAGVAPAAQRTGHGPSARRRPHLAHPERSSASEPEVTAADGIPGVVAAGRRAGAPPASRAAGGRRTGGKPLLVAAAVAGAVLATVPFVSHSGGRTNYEGLGQQVPVASESPGADGDNASSPDQQAGLPLQDPVDGGAAPVVPQPRATEGKEHGSEGTAPASPSGTGEEAGPRRSDGPLYGPPVPSASGKNGPNRGSVLGIGVAGPSAGDRSRPADPAVKHDSASGASSHTTAGPVARATKPGTVVKASALSAPTKTSTSTSQRVRSSGTASGDSTKAATATTAAPVKATATPVKATADPVQATADPVQATAPTETVAAKQDWSTRVITATTVIGPGESVASDRMSITMRTDGNLVITDENGTVRWSSNTQGTGYKAVFQDDGHFVVYTNDDRTVWSSGTAGNPGARLVIQADGNVTVLSAGGAVLWTANTQH